MSNEKGLLADQRLPDEIVDAEIITTEDEDAPAVDNDEVIAQRVRDTIKGKDLSVKQTFVPIGILNYSTNKDGKFTKAVVLDKHGVPKEIDNINVTNNTSVQKFDPDSGDYLLEYNEGDETISVKANVEIEATDPDYINEIIADEFFETTMEFLDSGAENTFYIIEGHNSVINGLDMNEAFRRRKHLVDLLEGVEPVISDQLANWLDRAENIDVLALSWDNATEFDEDLLDLKLYYQMSEGTTNLNSTMIVVWREIGGKPVGELLQININPASILSGAKTGSFGVTRRYELDEHVYKAMVITQADDVPVRVTFLSGSGTPQSMMPCAAFDKNIDKHLNVFKYFGLDNDYDENACFINELDTTHETEFKLGYLESTTVTTYVETRIVIEDEPEVIDLKSASSRKRLVDDAFTKPMVHMFKHNDGTERYLMAFVNVPEEIIYPLTEEEDTDGTSKE